MRLLHVIAILIFHELKCLLADFIHIYFLFFIEQLLNNHSLIFNNRIFLLQYGLSPYQTHT